VVDCHAPAQHPRAAHPSATTATGAIGRQQHVHAYQQEEKDSMIPFARTKKIAINLSLMAALATAATVPALANTTPVSQTINPGTLSATVISPLEYSPLAYEHDARAAVSTMNLQVDDSRGSGAGWHITIQASDLAYSGEYNGTDIPASQLSVEVTDPIHIAGAAIDGVNGPLKGTGGALDQARRVLYANSDAGEGTYQQSLEVTIGIPALTRVGTYSGQLTITEVSGPGE
jgi:hypothetical protein